MARNEKAHSLLRPELLAPFSTSEVGSEPLKEGKEEWNGDIDEEELEGANEDDKDEQWADDESYAADDVLNLEDVRNVKTYSVRTRAVLPTPSSRNKFSGTHKISAGVQKKLSKPRAKSTGLKRSSLRKAKELDMPPTPLGCEWRDAEDGWSLWRCWSERDEVIGGKYKKERYAGYLSRGAWGVMKKYDYETFIAVIGRRFRRHGGR